jgi:hypothetical protein
LRLLGPAYRFRRLAGERVGRGDLAPTVRPFVAIEAVDVGQCLAHVLRFEPGERISAAVGARLRLGLELLKRARRCDLRECSTRCGERNRNSGNERGAAKRSAHDRPPDVAQLDAALIAMISHALAAGNACRACLHRDEQVAQRL